MSTHKAEASAGNSKQYTPKKLNARQLRAMDLILSGTPLQEIAELLEVSRQTVSGWRNQHPEFKAKLQQLMAEAEEELSCSILLNDGFMLSNLRKLAAEGNGETRFKAIQFYFDRFGRKSEEGARVPVLSEVDVMLLRAMDGRREPDMASAQRTTRGGNV